MDVEYAMDFTIKDIESSKELHEADKKVLCKDVQSDKKKTETNWRIIPRL